MLAEVKASAADTAGQYTLVEITASPGLEAPLHVHYTEDEGFYVLEGNVTIVVGDEAVELAGGQHAFGPRNIPHRFTVGPHGARMIWVLTPGGFENLIERRAWRPRRRPSRRRASSRPRTSTRSSGGTATRCPPVEPSTGRRRARRSLAREPGVVRTSSDPRTTNGTLLRPWPSPIAYQDRRKPPD
jgi:quercetin dioxygenase-like cupin family protein